MTKLTCQMIQMKMTFNGRQPQNIKRRMRQQTVVGSYPYLSLGFKWTNPTFQMIQMKMTSSRTQTHMIKVEYINNKPKVIPGARVPENPFIKTMTRLSKGKFMWNLECGSAQTSLYFSFLSIYSCRYKILGKLYTVRIHE